MDRDVVVVAIGLVVGAATLHGINLAAPLSSGGDDERAAWRRLLGPVVPLLGVTAAVAGWAITDPDHNEALRPWTWCLAAAAAVVCLRAARRAWKAATTQPHGSLLCTRGLLAPRIWVDAYAREILDETAMAAALEHERAHVRGHDPLRIWLASVATDLQWPWPSAHRRFTGWLHALEVARDDEARANGARGADLAAAILAIAAAQRPSPMNGATASLTDDSRRLRARIARLLRDEPLRVRHVERGALRLAVVGVALVAAWSAGMLGGETALAWLARHGL